eukprot:CAMPEP_0206445410 /NCGR_PEP_ID=MMETSP0324_2-20121206/15491_1 /ASSEMBLY_ACC=CAM_ASM_000836 /TAXON_ID=2866 /ORGANISM="Crypthecodinium cohnii, Strain Seligo" /LENGTH=433 /DNA_ID=CAMNT_0053913619 /DNA_START=90 /DNA_END=1391 /DNA_ORIENTATION=+
MVSASAQSSRSRARLVAAVAFVCALRTIDDAASRNFVLTTSGGSSGGSGGVVGGVGGGGGSGCDHDLLATAASVAPSFPQPQFVEAGSFVNGHDPSAARTVAVEGLTDVPSNFHHNSINNNNNNNHHPQALLPPPPLPPFSSSFGLWSSFNLASFVSSLALATSSSFSQQHQQQHLYQHQHFHQQLLPRQLRAWHGHESLDGAVGVARMAAGKEGPRARSPVEKAPKKVVCIAGPPAAGKGTQCEKIVAQFGLVHVSTGDILRDHVKRGTALGKKAKEYMDQGLLVPDDLITNLVTDRLQEPDVIANGCLLDGFPRSAKQATSLIDAGINIHKFIRIDVPDEILIERGVGRRLDPQTGAIYHLQHDPPPPEVQHRLVHRSDDQEETIRGRLRAYHSQLQGVMAAMNETTAEVLLADGTPSPERVFDALRDFLE